MGFLVAAAVALRLAAVAGHQPAAGTSPRGLPVPVVPAALGLGSCDFFVSASALAAAGGSGSSNARTSGPTRPTGAGRRQNLSAAAFLPSLAAAQAAVRARLSSPDYQLVGSGRGDLVVCLGPGMHSLAAARGPLTFDGSDSPRGGNGRRVIWRGLGSKARPSIVTGGVLVSGWTAATLGGGPAFSAPVPAAASHLAAVRQLWVAGRRANRTAVATQVNCSVDCTTPNASKSIKCSPGCQPAAAVCPKPAGRCPASAIKCVGFEQGTQWGHCEHCSCESENALPVFTPWFTNSTTRVGPTAVGFTTSAALPESWANAKPNTIEFVWPVHARSEYKRVLEYLSRYGIR